jgi:hypothetical protein
MSEDFVALKQHRCVNASERVGDDPPTDSNPPENYFSLMVTDTQQLVYTYGNRSGSRVKEKNVGGYSNSPFFPSNTATVAKKTVRSSVSHNS